jgi:hypothetical protein
MTNRFKLQISSISHQQAVAEHWDLPNTEIFQSKDVASEVFVPIICEKEALMWPRA